MGEGGGPTRTVVDARSTTVVAIGTVVVAGSAVVVGGTAAVDGTTAVAGVAVVVGATVVVAGTAVVVGATVVVADTAVVVGATVVVGVVVGAVFAVGGVVVVVDSAEVGAAVSELPPHPETTNKTVTATVCALTFQVCHPSPVRGGATTGASRCRYVQRLKGRCMASRSGALNMSLVLGDGLRNRRRLCAHRGTTVRRYDPDRRKAPDRQAVRHRQRKADGLRGGR